MHSFEPEDLFRMRFLQGGQFSPDGRRIVYVVTHIEVTGDKADVDNEAIAAGRAYEKEKEFSTIFLYNVEGGTSRQMTGGKSRDNNPRFSPDGKYLAFSSDRGEKPQIYVMPVDGGEARQLTKMKQGVGGSLVWSPDGKKIAFTAGPDYGDKTPPNLAKDVYRVTRNVYRFDAIGYLDQAVQDIYVIDVDGDAGSGGDAKRLTADTAMNGGEMQWSPDGHEIYYTASMLPDVFAAFYPVLRVVNMDGQIREIVNDMELMKFSLTPDGKRVVLLGTPHGKVIGTKSDLWVKDLSSGQCVNRTSNLAVGVGGSLGGDMPAIGLVAIHLPISGDGKTTYVRVQDGGTVQIYRIALEGDEDWSPVVTGERAAILQDMANGKLLYSVDHLNATPNLYLANVDGGDEQQITTINDEFFAGKVLPSVEHLSFSGTDGVGVEGWYLKPPQGEAPYPTILYIHGGPHAAYGNRFFFDWQMLCSAGYGVLVVNHRASTGYGDAFSTAIKGDWGNLDYGDLMAGVDEAIGRGLADADRLGVCGTSGGGNLSCWIVGQTDRFKAAIPQNPVTNWVSFYGVSDIGVWFAVEELGGHPHEIPEIYAKCSPITYAHRCKTPTLMVQSEHDWRCPAEQSEQFYTVLKANGCIAEMLRQPGGYHSASSSGAINLRRAHNNAMLDWFGKYVMRHSPNP